MSSVHPLLEKPLWRPEHLGSPIPVQAGEQAVSVCLPTWANVLGYEEGEARVIDALKAGYPRFRLPSSVLELGRQALPEALLALPFPLAAAKRICAQLETEQHQVQTQPWPLEGKAKANILGVSNPEAATRLRILWRYYGEGLSSRRAQTLLQKTSSSEAPNNAQAKALAPLRELLAQAYEVPSTHLFLFPSGMAANAACLRALKQLRGSRQSYQFGFPYVDCLRLQAEFSGVKFATADSIEPTLHGLQEEAQATSQNYLALFCEAITNPLIQVLNLPALHEACQQAQLPLVVDDSVPSAGLTRSLRHADLLTSSLTKWVSGHADVMGGLVALNPTSSWAKALLPLLIQAAQEVPLAEEDAAVLLNHAQVFAQRVQQAARNALLVGQWLEQQRQSSKIKQLWWSHSKENLPPWQALALNSELAQQSAAPLLSFQLFSESQAAAFYDSLRLSKGPSFGTEWSLACPYTLLAHYDELDWCAKQGVPRDLIRLSIGLEDPADLIARLQDALQKSC